MVLAVVNAHRRSIDVRFQRIKRIGQIRQREAACRLHLRLRSLCGNQNTPGGKNPSLHEITSYQHVGNFPYLLRQCNPFHNPSQ